MTEINLGSTQLRRHFPLVERAAYLDSASKGALGDSVGHAIADVVADWAADGAPWDRWLWRIDQSRVLYSELTESKPSSVFLSGSVSAALSSVLLSLSYAHGRSELLVLDGDFPTLAVSAAAANLAGARIRFVKSTGDQPLIDAISEALSPSTRALVITQVHHAAHHELDLQELGALVHSYDALLIVDAYHALGVVPSSVMNADVIISGAMKYLLGSPGGLAYCACSERMLADAKPVISGWMGSNDPFSNWPLRRPSEGAGEFNTGLPPIIEVAAALAGMEFLMQWTQQEIELHVRRLTSECMEALADIGIRTKSAGPLVVWPTTGRTDLLKVRLGSWGALARASFHVYNNSDDVQNLVQALTSNRA